MDARPIWMAVQQPGKEIVWAIAAHDRKYDKDHISIRPY
jgi:hypothetical protein